MRLLCPSTSLESSFRSSANKFILASDAIATWYAQELGSLASDNPVMSKTRMQRRD